MGRNGTADLGRKIGPVTPNRMKTAIYAIHAETVRRADIRPLYRMMPERMARAEHCRRAEDSLLIIGAGILLAEALGIRDELLLRSGPYGKPFAPGYPEFNLSHSGQWCVLAAAEEDIGIDIERVDPANLEAAPAALTPGERIWMRENPAERFHMLWTWKESALKALGLGMTMEPAGVEVLPFIRHEPVTLNGRALYAANPEGPGGYRISVCGVRPPDPAEWQEWTG